MGLKESREMPYIEIGAHQKRFHIVVDRNITTKYIWLDCKFCAFYTHEKRENAYILSFEEIDRKIEELLAIGGTQILFQVGFTQN